MKALILIEAIKLTGNHGKVLTNSSLKDWGSPGFSAWPAASLFMPMLSWVISSTLKEHPLLLCR